MNDYTDSTITDTDDEITIQANETSLPGSSKNLIHHACHDEIEVIPESESTAGSDRPDPDIHCDADGPADEGSIGPSAETEESDGASNEGSGSASCSDGRVHIVWNPHRQLDARNQVLDALAATGRFFEHGGALAEVWYNARRGEYRLQQLSAPELALLLNDFTAWQRPKSGRLVQIDPPDQFCARLIRAGVRSALPAVQGLSWHPFLRDDGTLFAAGGYDPLSHVYGCFDVTQYSLAARPSRDDAGRALQQLKSLVSEFAFAGPDDHAAALAAMLTATIRASLPTAPMFHVRAHSPASGKSYLCAVISALAAPTPCSPITFPASEDECDKLLMAHLRHAPAVIEFDNLTSDIPPFKKLCKALTSERISGRVLGSSQMLDVSTRTLVLSSGNNVDPVGDMTRRCITINLDVRSEAPGARAYQRPDLLQHLRANRERYVADCLTIVLAWLAAGSPRTPVAALASYARWSDWCRQPLLWLGLEDAAASIYRTREEDGDRQSLSMLLSIWHARSGSRPVMVRDLVTWSQEVEHGDEQRAADLRELLEDISESHGRGIDRKRLGWWLKRHTGQVVNGLRLEQVPRNMNAQCWRVVPV